MEKITKEHEEVQIENRGAKRSCGVLKLVLKSSLFMLQYLLFHDWLNAVEFSQCGMYRMPLFF